MNVFVKSGEIEDKVDELPPSAKLVFKVLEYNGQLTQKGIAEETRLSVRTVRYALNRLESKDVVEKVPCFEDGRRTLYDINDESEETVEESVESELGKAD